MWAPIFEADETLQPWIFSIDDANFSGAEGDVVTNGTSFQAMTTAIPLYSNLRVLSKSFEYVTQKPDIDRQLLWTIWHLEIVKQIEPTFRRDLSSLVTDLQEILKACYEKIGAMSYAIHTSDDVRRIRYEVDYGFTLFSIFRSLFWEAARLQIGALEESKDPQEQANSEKLRRLLTNPSRVDFVLLLSMLPIPSAPSYDQLINGGTSNSFHIRMDADLIDLFGWELANY